VGGTGIESKESSGLQGIPSKLRDTAAPNVVELRASETDETQVGTHCPSSPPNAISSTLRSLYARATPDAERDALRVAISALELGRRRPLDAQPDVQAVAGVDAKGRARLRPGK
jgi:hypothetical protein